ncbi:Phospholipase A I-like protein [Cladobotryum mycophilum]|uniref:Phospholipase A I-like protein n=1 Tax=Cladobotryum mycophilum TaxID=491253 RepID=A0ABR0SCD0_9HYPO
MTVTPSAGSGEASIHIHGSVRVSSTHTTASSGTTAASKIEHNVTSKLEVLAKSPTEHGIVILDLQEIKIRLRAKVDDQSTGDDEFLGFYPKIITVIPDSMLYVECKADQLQRTTKHLVELSQKSQSSGKKAKLPRVIIAVISQDEKEDEAPHGIRAVVQETLSMRNPTSLSGLQKRFNHLQKSHEPINSAKGLLKPYFSSIRIVRFQNSVGPTEMLESSMDLLDDLARAEGFRSILDMRQYSSSIKVSGFFGKKKPKEETCPFCEAIWDDVYQMPSDIVHSIVNLAVNVSRIAKDRDSDNRNKMWAFAASCLLLAELRDSADPHIDAELFARLSQQCDRAVELYWNKYLPCPKCQKRQLKFWFGSEDVTPKEGDITKQTLESAQATIRNMVKESLHDLFASFAEKNMSKTHAERARAFYGKIKEIDGLVSHSTCLSCLEGIPENCLPCGHIICNDCVQNMGEYIDGGFFKLKKCPLIEHRQDNWSNGWIGSQKPKQAAPRILSLDGGGIKGMVELEILTRVQQFLGEVPLREFFDLIVGTSAGGIISCALGPAGLSVQECREKFALLCKEAFHKDRDFLFVDDIFSIVRQGSYDPDYIEKALKETFTDDANLFGWAPKSKSVPVKVAVTTCTPNGQAIVLSNYNRKSSEYELYKLQRTSPRRTIKVWEAQSYVSSTDVLPPLKHEGTGLLFLDGGVFHNNPIRIAGSEFTRIWPESANSHPDILLSLGTGFFEDELDMYHTNGLDDEAASRAAKSSDPSNYITLLKDILVNQLDSSMCSERIWYEWLQTRATPSVASQRKYRRLNAQFDEVVQMDDASDEALNRCRQAVLKVDDAQFRDIADHLIASSFYYSFKQDEITSQNKTYKCKGAIKCRLLPDSIRLLGKHLESLSSPQFQPYFHIKETHEDTGSPHVHINADIIRGMKEKGEFHLPLEVDVSHVLAETEITLILRPERTGNQDGHHISAFPRKLQHDYDVSQIAVKEIILVKETSDSQSLRSKLAAARPWRQVVDHAVHSVEGKLDKSKTSEWIKGKAGMTKK